MGKHVTCQFSMGSGQSFIESADMLLVLKESSGNATEAFRRYSEDILIEEYQIITRSPLLIPNSERWEYFTEHAGVLTVYIPYTMYRWKNGSSRLLKVVYYQYELSCSLYRYLPCLCIPYIKRTAIVFISCSVCARIRTMHVPTSCVFSQWTLQHSAVDLLFTTKILFVDKLCFTGTKITNIHSEHVGLDENSHVIKTHHWH
jgi:hypothetical protein